jgi:hypothetical protein
VKHYRHGSHSAYQCHYHFVFIPKYRKPVLRGEVGIRLRELIREICKSHDIEILKGHIRAGSRSLASKRPADALSEPSHERDQG